MKDLEITCSFLDTLPESDSLGSLKKGLDLEEQGEKVFMLSAGKPDFDTPDFIKNAAAYVGERIRWLILCSPSNPAGTVCRQPALQQTAAAAGRENFMILSDEVYEKPIRIPLRSVKKHVRNVKAVKEDA